MRDEVRVRKTSKSGWEEERADRRGHWLPHSLIHSFRLCISPFLCFPPFLVFCLVLTTTTRVLRNNPVLLYRECYVARKNMGKEKENRGNRGKQYARKRQPETALSNQEERVEKMAVLSMSVENLP